MVVADSVWLFAVAWAVQGMSRALDSGPLEAWYVDSVHLAEPDADVTTGLSRAGAADGLGLSFGAVLGGVIPLMAGNDSGALAVPLVVAAGLTVVSLVCVVLLVTPLRTSDRSGAAALRAGVREVPVVVRDTVVLVARNRLLRLLWIVSFLTGTVLTTMELLGPLQFAQLSGTLAEGSAVYGVVMAVSFAAAGVGALLAPGARRLAGGSVAWASLAFALLGALTMVGVALSPGVFLAGVAFALFYLFNGGGWPLRQQLMHEQTTSAQRSTTVSAKSLALMLGGMLGSLLIPRLAEAAGYPAGFLAGAAALVLLGVVSIGLRAARSAPAPAELTVQASNAVG
jgi:MFS family permease